MKIEKIGLTNSSNKIRILIGLTINVLGLFGALKMYVFN